MPFKGHVVDGWEMAKTVSWTPMYVSDSCNWYCALQEKAETAQSKQQLLELLLKLVLIFELKKSLGSQTESMENKAAFQSI